MKKMLTAVVLSTAVQLAAESGSLPARGLCAHRGDRAEYPENTVPAFEAAVRKGAAMVEFDVTRCKTGELVIMHDSTVNRTTDGYGEVMNLTFAEIRALDAGVKFDPKFRGVKVPTFDEAVDSMPKDGVWLNVHCKSDVTAEVALKLKAKGRLHQAFIAAEPSGIAVARKVVPEVKTCLMAGPWTRWSDGYTKAYFEAAVREEYDFCQPHFAALVKEDSAAFHAKGGKVNYFWVNDEKKLADAFEAGVDFPLTDRLDVMLAAQRGQAAGPRPPFRPEEHYDTDRLIRETKAETREFGLPPASWRGARVAVLGDSITDPGQTSSQRVYWQYLAAWFGWQVHAYGISGHTWAEIPGQIDRAAKELGDGVDAFLILVGTNDYAHGLPLGGWWDETEGETNWWAKPKRLKRREPSMDPGTFRGRMNVALAKLRRGFPDAQVVILTPTKRAFFQCSETNVQPGDEWTNVVGLHLADYVQAEREGAEIWGCPVIDLFAEAPLLPQLKAEYGGLYRDSDRDRLHPCTEGHRRLADCIYLKLQSIPATFRRYR